MNIELTPAEDQICTLIDECTTFLKREQNITTSCRIAGGWVRDKLLGLQCNDIDIALSDMMGLTFAEHLAAYAATRDVHTGTISKIAQNPDQSKHLETATLKLHGLNLDLVNLRSEEYAADSRIPTQVSFGTPLQDALRRDITINSLFFNIHTRSVEDLTGKGLIDLRSGTIRTPLPPQDTFLDDPLRILRCVRFAGKYGFQMVPEIRDAAKDTRIQDALINKIARERVGEEVAKMMTSRDPLVSIQLIHELSLYHTVFSVVPKEIKARFSGVPASSERAIASAAILHALLSSVHEPDSRLPQLHPSLFTALNADSSYIARLYLASFSAPFAAVTYVDKKQKSHPVVAVVLRESLKLGTQNHYLDGIPALFEAANLLTAALLDEESLKYPSPRIAIGTLVRHKIIHNPNTGSHWTTSTLFSLVQELIPCYCVQKNEFDVSEASKIIERYNGFLRRIDELELTGAAELRPILNGREVMKANGSLSILKEQRKLALSGLGRKRGLEVCI
ncbi:hypothetical protein AX17_000231 [Amanita inopinata Kibby_2008]|nr:hypothetical protein AX17_000231 [Amanita inopinata Kibby_2008]